MRSKYQTDRLITNQCYICDYPLSADGTIIKMLCYIGIRLGEISKGHIIQSFSDTLVDFVEKKCCHSSLLPKLRGGHPLEKYSFDQ